MITLKLQRGGREGRKRQRTAGSVVVGRLFKVHQDYDLFMAMSEAS